MFDYTNLYHALLINKVLNENNPKWIEYLDKVESSMEEDNFDELLNITYYTYLQNLQSSSCREVAPEIQFGCFGYEIWENNRLRIHFENKDTERNCSSLHHSKIVNRYEELRRMFVFIRQNYNKAFTVYGRSWLYNLNAYRQLFPLKYLQNSEVASSRYAMQRINLWGQFLNWNGDVKETSWHFLSSISTSTSIEEVYNLFPYKVLVNECSVENFYKHYNT